MKKYEKNMEFSDTLATVTVKFVAAVELVGRSDAFVGRRSCAWAPSFIF